MTELLNALLNLLLVLIKLAFSIVILIYRKLKKRYKRKQIENDEKDYNQCYQAKSILTVNEWHEHRKLLEYATQKKLIVCPKVRLLDIIEPRSDQRDNTSLRYKVQSKHVDFVICDNNMNIKAILELDDSSHDRKERIERDQFVDQILTSVGYKIIHTRSITETTLEML